jgi:hypothetical protein
MKKERTDPKALAAYLGGNYAQLQGMIKQADTKANIVIALIGALVSMFFNVFISETNQLAGWQVATILGLLLFSGGYAVSVLYPRTAKPTGKFSLTYFKDAQNVDVVKWSKKFLEEDQEKLITKDMMNNIKAISMILDTKFKRLRMAYMLFGLAIVVKTLFDLILFLS